FGHISYDRIKTMVRNSQLRGIDSLSGKPEFCEPCVLGKMKKQPFDTGGRERASRALQLVHADIGGPVTPTSRDSYRYWLMLVDDHTEQPWVYFMKLKSEVAGLLKRWKADVE
ncbi:hypothetical protein AURDEDRAFT_36936, partial [Auricularia subglabra TFB-10046 SS5]